MTDIISDEKRDKVTMSQENVWATGASSLEISTGNFAEGVTLFIVTPKFFKKIILCLTFFSQASFGSPYFNGSNNKKIHIYTNNK